MAHRGKHWKLWFRRDANWNLNNYAEGYPEAYFIRSRDFISSPRYAVSLIDTVVAVNVNKTYDRTWTSAPVGGFFDNVYWIVEMFGRPDESVSTAKFSLWHNAVVDTPLFSATYKCSQVVLGYESLFLSGLVQLHFLSADINVDPVSFRVFIQAARYGRYNP